MSKRCPAQPGIDTTAKIPSTTMRSLYFTMLKIRKFEEQVAELLPPNPKSEIICPVHLYIGQEAVAAGVCASLRNDDYVFSTHRSHGHYIAKGGDIKALMAELYGKSTGCSRGRGGSMHVTAPGVGFPGSSAIVAGTIPLAVGAALAFKMRGNESVAVAFFGDGAANEGVFYESLNFASLKKLPVVFICENNLYSTHMPVSECLANTEIYRKAEAFNMPGVRIDGNNVMEAFASAKKAIADARRGKGPTLIECLTYRWRGHVGPNFDLDKGLRSQEEFDYWMNKCPLKTYEAYLLKSGTISEQEKKRINKQVEGLVQEALTFARESPCPEPGEVLSNVFSA